jgi:formylglycine-generating enzyme required for sulfatase activity
MRAPRHFNAIVATGLSAVALALLSCGRAHSPCNHACEASKRDTNGCCPEEPPPQAPPMQAPPNASAARGPAPSCSPGMAGLAGGTFAMGDRRDTVTVLPFCLDVTEVTVAAYASCVHSGQCTAAATTVDWPNISPADRATGMYCNGSRADRSSHPVNCVDWGQAKTYCQAQGKRLPSEEEWEWAARGGSEGRTYPWGNATPNSQLCWSGMTKRDSTCPVGSFPEGDAPGGIHDLGGNVSEWTSNAFDARGQTRCIRGGGWNLSIPANFHAVLRIGSAPSSRVANLGIRCAR